MGKRKYKKGIKSLEKEIEFHENIKLEKAKEEGRIELVGYYKEEIKEMKNKISKKEFKFLPRNKRIKLKKKLAKETKE